MEYDKGKIYGMMYSTEPESIMASDLLLLIPMLRADVEKYKAKLTEQRYDCALREYRMLGLPGEMAARQGRALHLPPEKLTVGQMNRAVRDLREILYQLQLQRQNQGIRHACNVT